MIIACLIIYLLFDLLLYKFITHSPFVYTVKDYVVEPIVDGILFGVITWSIEKAVIKKINSIEDKTKYLLFSCYNGFIIRKD